jgi:hypothetical protein
MPQASPRRCSLSFDRPVSPSSKSTASAPEQANSRVMQIASSNCAEQPSKQGCTDHCYLFTYIISSSVVIVQGISAFCRPETYGAPIESSPALFQKIARVVFVLRNKGNIFTLKPLTDCWASQCGYSPCICKPILHPRHLHEGPAGLPVKMHSTRPTWEDCDLTHRSLATGNIPARLQHERQSI